MAQGFISRGMSVLGVDVGQVIEVHHDAADCFGKRLIVVFVYQDVAAETVRNAGQRVGVGGLVKTAEILLRFGNDAKVQQQEHIGCGEDTPDGYKEQCRAGVCKDKFLYGWPEKADQAEQRQQNEDSQLDDFINMKSAHDASASGFDQ